MQFQNVGPMEAENRKATRVWEKGNADIHFSWENKLKKSTVKI